VYTSVPGTYIYIYGLVVWLWEVLSYYAFPINRSK
jgi:hypothetical protein